MQPKKKKCDGELCKGALAFIWKNIVEDGERLKFCQACWNKKNSSGKPTITKRQEIKRSTTPIKKFSDKRQKENAAYSALRKVFLEQHPNCVPSFSEICSVRATTIHHKKGRGEYFLDTSSWLPACMGCHEHIERNPALAYELGYSESRLKTTKDE